MKLNKLLVIAALGLSASAATMSELESRIEELEYASYANFFNWSGTLENRFDYSTREDMKNEVTGNSSYFSTQLKLDMASNPTKRLNFVGRISMRKYWNNGSFDGEANGKTGSKYAGGMGGTGDGIFNTWSNGRTIGNGTPYIERAYINYSFTDSLVFTIGRLPTIDGMPKHISTGEGQQGSYPVLAFSAILDGMALTHKADIFGGTLNTRAIYTPFHYANFGSATGTKTGQVPANQKDSDGERISTNDPMYSLMLDFNKKTSFAQNLNVILQYVKIDDAFFGASGQNTDALGNSVSDAASSTFRFDVSTIALYTELRRIMNTGFTLALSYNMTDYGSRGGLSSLGLNGGCDNNSETCDVDGSRYIVSARYDFAKFGFGAEYIDNEANTFAYDTTPMGPISIYGTAASTAKHFFANYNVDQNMRLVLGYAKQNIEKTYTYSVLGKGDEADIDRDNFYTRLIATF